MKFPIKGSDSHEVLSEGSRDPHHPSLAGMIYKEIGDD